MPVEIAEVLLADPGPVDVLGSVDVDVGCVDEGALLVDSEIVAIEETEELLDELLGELPAFDVPLLM